MTGYAAVAADTPRGRLSFELRTVNSRFLDLQLRVADELRAHEPLLREIVSSRVARGKVEGRLFFASGPGSAQRAEIDAGVLAELTRVAEQVRRALPEASPLRIMDVLRWPGMLVEAPLDEAHTRATVASLARTGVDELMAARRREGDRLVANIRSRVLEMQAQVAAVAPVVPQALAAYQDKLTQRLRDVLGTADDDRVRAELAVFGTKIDVDEELTRLGAHLLEVLRVIEHPGPAGKRLDFLAQELNREANTLASKSVSAELSDAALALKVLIEQMREQVQNIE